MAEVFNPLQGNLSERLIAPSISYKGFAELTSLNLNSTPDAQPAAVVKLLCIIEAVKKQRDEWAKHEEVQVQEYASIIKAAYNGELEEVRRHLQGNGEAILERTQTERNALHAASANGHLETVQLLVQTKLSINGKDATGITPLRMAVAGNHIEVTKYLLRQKAEPNIADHTGWTPLHSAAINGRADIIKCLKTSGADVTKQTKRGYTALFLASVSGYVDCVTALVEIEAGTNKLDADIFRSQLNLVDDAGFSALHCSALKGHAEITKILLREGASPQQKSKSGIAPLTLAAAEGHLSCVRELYLPTDDLHEALTIAMLRGQYEISRYFMVTDDLWSELHAAVLYGEIENIRSFITEGGHDFDERAGGEGCTLLMLAIWQENLECTKILIEEGKANVNKPDNNSCFPLHLAVKLQNEEIMKVLLANRAQPNVLNNEGKAPLHDACFKGDLNAIKLLIKARADVDIKVSTEVARFHTPLQYAAHGGHIECVKFLLGEGALIETPGPERCSALLAAASRNQVEVIEYLLGKDPELQVTDKQENGVLFWAALHNNIDLLKRYLDGGQIDYDAKNSSGQTALHVASGFGHFEAVKLLLDNHAEIDIKDNDECTPLQNAAECNRADVIKCLLEHGADKQTKDFKGESPLHRAALVGSIDAVEILVEMKADIGAKAHNKTTPLHLAVAEFTEHPVWFFLSEFRAIFLHGHREKWNKAKCVEYLLDKGADINATDEVGCTPLMFAAATSGFDGAEILISKGADIDAKTIDRQYTALHVAVRGGHSEILRLILSQSSQDDRQSRARLEAVTKDKWTPLHVAICNGNLECVRLLYDYGANLEAQTIIGTRPFYKAVGMGSVEIVKFLLEKGVNINTGGTLEGNETPLHLAVDKGYRDVVEILIEHGADLDARTKRGRNVFHIASEHGLVECLQILVDFVIRIDGGDGDAGQGLARRSLIDSTGPSTMTPLYYAIPGGHLGCVQILCKAGANVESQSEKGITPLLQATDMENVDIMKCLLTWHADVNNPGGTGLAPINYAASCGLAEALGTLVKFNADVNAQAKDNFNPILLAALGGHNSCVEILIAHGADPTNSDGNSVVHVAAFSGRLETLEYVLNLEGMSELVSSKDNKGHLPLHKAAGEGNLDCVKLLLALGVSQDEGGKSYPLIDEQDCEGSTPLLLSVAGGYSPVIEALTDAGANLNIHTNDGITCLHIGVALCGNPALLGRMIQTTYGFELIVSRYPEYEPLTENEKLLLYLLDRGAKCTMVDARGYTPIHYTNTHRLWELLVSRIPIEERNDLLDELDVKSKRIKRTVQQVIGPEGGEIHLSRYGVHLTVPAGALDKDHNISMRLLETFPVSSIQGEEMMASFGVELKPGGLTFKHPAQLKLPHCASVVDTTDVKVVLYHFRGGELTTQDVAVGNLAEIPACTVWEKELELYIDDFCYYWTLFPKSWTGKEMICLPYSSRAPIGSANLRFYLANDLPGVEQDLTHSATLRDAERIGDPQPFFVKWSNEDVHVAVMNNKREEEDESIRTEDIRRNNQTYRDFTKLNTEHYEKLNMRVFQGRETSISCKNPLEKAPEIEAQGNDAEGSAQRVTQLQLIKLSEIISHEKYTELCVRLGCSLTSADNKLAKHVKDCQKALLEVLNEWNQRTGRNHRDKLIKVLEDAEVSGLVTEIFPDYVHEN